MYESYWGLSEKPFKNTPDPRFFFESSQHEEALMKLLYAIRENLGAAMLTGVFGCGKTVVSRSLLAQLPAEQTKVALITNPQVDYVELLRSIARRLKSVELPLKRTELSADALLEIIEEILENNSRDGKETVVIIDEAHVIEEARIFEGLRLLLNFQKADRFMLTLLLLGQPELKQKIEDNKQLEQRIAVKCHLSPFDLKETERYILHRLAVAGRGRPLFDDNAIGLIHERCGGIPRRINRLCDICLLIGSSQKAPAIDKSLVEESLKSLEA